MPGRQFQFRAEVKGTFPEYSYPTAETLVQKKGAQVMFIKNGASGELRYYNGSIGLVVEIGEKRLTVFCEGDADAIEVPELKQEYERYLLLQLFDFRSLLYQQDTMERIFADFFYHSHASLKQMHDKALMKISERGFTVDTYLKEKQMSMLDAIDASPYKPNGRKSSTKRQKKR